VFSKCLVEQKKKTLSLDLKTDGVADHNSGNEFQTDGAETGNRVCHSVPLLVVVCVLPSTLLVSDAVMQLR